MTQDSCKELAHKRKEKQKENINKLAFFRNCREKEFVLGNKPSAKDGLCSLEEITAF